MIRESEFGGMNQNGYNRESEFPLSKFAEDEDQQRFESLPKSNPEYMNVIVEEDENQTRLSHDSKELGKEELAHIQEIKVRLEDKQSLKTLDTQNILFNDLPLQQNHLNPDDLIKTHLPDGSGVVRVSQVMKDFMAKK